MKYVVIVKCTDCPFCEDLNGCDGEATDYWYFCNLLSKRLEFADEIIDSECLLKDYKETNEI